MNNNIPCTSHHELFALMTKGWTIAIDKNFEFFLYSPKKDKYICLPRHQIIKLMEV